MEKSYFAASNSCDGFKNYYGECFARADRLYIIKGGPGTGKSTLLKRVAKAAQERGYDTEKYYCSSDHTSLDGVLFFGESGCVGIIDGTYPHPYVERLPGVREEIVNTGRFWDRRVLGKHAEVIRELCAKKSLYYDQAYAYLRACGNLRKVSRSYAPREIDGDKINKVISRLTKSIADGEGYSCIPALINCIGMLGRAHLSTFEESAEKIYLITGGAADDVLRGLSREAIKKGWRIRVACDPIYPSEIDGIYLEDSRVWFAREGAVAADIKEKHARKTSIVSTKRLCAEWDESSGKEKKYCERLTKMCIDGALSRLYAAGECHFSLEEYYRSAMDFSSLEEYSERMIKRILE